MRSSSPFSLPALYLLQLCLSVAAFSVLPKIDGDTTQLACFNGSTTLIFNETRPYPFKLLMGKQQKWRLSFRLYDSDQHTPDQPGPDRITLYNVVVKGKTKSTVLFCHKPGKGSRTDFEIHYPAASDYEKCQVVLDEQINGKPRTINQIACTN
ncbi:hypothetical protein BCR37DRAFT_412806 [Protomyces lactucae-debilis]|uniref:Uncharacterized protein n=1 Tax=Protomyces lactucae-debilis TaxID=2754530 RepID=A0A1Y2FK87_PROLT|nr:uncharacterized protein BCR37DRAFT_412806 [Protomyces lactucae-debilis]ORY84368.1 hypothetical protein BCR37DRAFT_412806 [Protomyces lactucae-debilis]